MAFEVLIQRTQKKFDFFEWCTETFGAWGERWWTYPESRAHAKICFLHEEDLLYFVLMHGEKIVHEKGQTRDSTSAV